MCVGGYVCVCRCTQRPEEGVRSVGTEVVCSYETPEVGCWNLDWGALEEQQVLLSTVTL